MVSSKSRLWAAWMARSVGILVKRDTTSKETRTSFFSIVCLLMNWANSRELRTWCSVLPTNGDKILTRCLDNEYVGEDVKETIGLSGMSGLWIFGRA